MRHARARWRCSDGCAGGVCEVDFVTLRRPRQPVLLQVRGLGYGFTLLGPTVAIAARRACQTCRKRSSGTTKRPGFGSAAASSRIGRLIYCSCSTRNARWLTQASGCIRRLPAILRCHAGVRRAHSCSPIPALFLCNTLDRYFQNQCNSAFGRKMTQVPSTMFCC